MVVVLVAEMDGGYSSGGYGVGMVEVKGGCDCGGGIDGWMDGGLESGRCNGDIDCSGGVRMVVLVIMVLVMEV